MLRVWLKFLIACILCFSFTSSAKESDLHELTISKLQSLRSTQAVTYEQVVQYYLNRIKALDPKLNSVVAINPNAIAIAKQKDLIFNKGNATGMLFGVPILVKDNIDVAGLPTTVGAKALSQNIAKTDASIIAKLRKEGAIILGKTNLSEWANFKSMQSSSGFSAIGGQTRNPYNLQYTPCGSSSGSAVAVAADLTLIAIGTETDGSILCPASMTGIVGIKPTNYKISKRGIVPLAKSQDTAGPMARTVEDATLVYSAITDDISVSLTSNVDYKWLSLGLLNSMQSFYSEHMSALVETLDKFAIRGTKIYNHLPFEQRDVLMNAEMEVLMFEFQRDINEYLSKQSHLPVKNLEQLILFNKAHGDTKQDLLESANAFTDKDKYSLSQIIVQEFALQQLKKLQEKYKIDVFMAPTTGKPWKIDEVNGDSFTGSSTWLAAMIGGPAVTVPLQMIEGIPSGLTFFGLPGDDAKVLAVAAQFEKLVPARVPPAI
ncbi:amidase family protein [Pseudoalteromonas xiamenensis]